MIISKSHKFVFIRIPRTASTSIEEVLIKYGKKVSLSKQFGTHATFLDFQKEYWDTYHKYSRIAFVRNSWDRMRSYYDYYESEHKSGMDFFAFLKWLGKYQPWQFNQIHWLEKYNRTIAPMLSIGKFETLQYSFDFICNLINIPIVKLPMMNVSKTKTKHTQDTIKLINDFCKEEIKCFEFKEPV